MLADAFLTTALVAWIPLVASVHLPKLFVSSYAGNVTTLGFGEGNDTLTELSSTSQCKPNPSWLSFDPKNFNLFCLDENVPGDSGNIHAFKVDGKSGALTHVNNVTVPQAPVNSLIYTGTNGTQLLIAAHYTTALTSWMIDSKTGAFTKQQQYLNFTLSRPGPKPQQAKSHPHQVILDPTKQFVVVPDLGADLIRVFHVDPQTLLLEPTSSYPVKPGSGPRHGAFHPYSTPDNTIYYLVTEIGNTVSSYKVGYLPDNAGLNFTLQAEASTLGDNKAHPISPEAKQFNAAAELSIAPNGKSLLVSNRNFTGFFPSIANPNPANSTKIASDSLASFTLDGKGGMKFAALYPSGGSYPRSFRESREGSMVVVLNQMDFRVVLWKKDVESGKIEEKPVGWFEGLGNVTSAIWGPE